MIRSKRIFGWLRCEQFSAQGAISPGVVPEIPRHAAAIRVDVEAEQPGGKSCVGLSGFAETMCKKAASPQQVSSAQNNPLTFGSTKMVVKNNIGLTINPMNPGRSRTTYQNVLFPGWALIIQSAQSDSEAWREAV